MADLLLSNRQVHTPEGWAEAVAVTDGRILADGICAALAAHQGDGTEVIDLQGQVVLPGFHDLHVHPLYGGMTPAQVQAFKLRYQCANLLRHSSFRLRTHPLVGKERALASPCLLLAASLCAAVRNSM